MEDPQYASSWFDVSVSSLRGIPHNSVPLLLSTKVLDPASNSLALARLTDAVQAYARMARVPLLSRSEKGLSRGFGEWVQAPLPP